jgi:RNA polymerase sigma-70 factor (ECF subfamily)
VVEVTLEQAAQSPGAGSSARSAPPDASFEDVYTAYFGFVWRSLRRLGVAHAVLEDAAQDTFVVVHRRFADLRADASIKAFLFSIAFRVAQSYRRKVRRKGTHSLDVEQQVSNDPGPFEHAVAARSLQLVEQFVDSLDDNKRVVFVLSELEQMSAPEIAEALAVPVNTVYSRLRHARERFVAYLAERGNPHA